MNEPTALLLTLSTIGLLAIGPHPPAPLPEDNFPVEVLGYELALAIDPPARRIEGTAAVEVVARASGVTTIPFALHAALRVTSVTEGEAAVPFSAGEGVGAGRVITVTPEPPLAPRKPRTFTFRYAGEGVDPGEGDPDDVRVLVVRPREIRLAHQARWYPLVPRDDEARSVLTAPVALALSLPPGMESLGPGRAENRKRSEDLEVHSWSSRFSVRASILAGAYEVREAGAGKRRLRILSFPEHAEGARRWAEEVGKAFKFYEKWLGKVKNATHGIAEMVVRNPARPHHFEADGFSVYDGAFFDGREVDALVAAHEAAHLWWGGQIDPAGAGERFLTESLAEYSALRYLEEEEGEAVAADAARGLIDRYLEKRGDEAPLATATPASPRYEPVVYAKGGMALRTLESWAGTKDFDAGLKLYLKRFRSGRNAPRLSDFVEAMRAKCGAQVEAWAEEWLTRAGAPSYAVDYTIAGELTGAKSVTVTLTQRGSVYTNPVEVDILLENGGTERVRLEPRTAEVSQMAIVHDFVRGLRFDPEARVVSLDRAR